MAMATDTWCQQAPGRGLRVDHTDPGAGEDDDSLTPCKPGTIPGVALSEDYLPREVQGLGLHKPQPLTKGPHGLRGAAGSGGAQTLTAPDKLAYPLPSPAQLSAVQGIAVYGPALSDPAHPMKGPQLPDWSMEPLRVPPSLASPSKPDRLVSLGTNGLLVAKPSAKPRLLTQGEVVQEPGPWHSISASTLAFEGLDRGASASTLAFSTGGSMYDIRPLSQGLDPDHTADNGG